MSDKFILNGHEVVAEPDLYRWGDWFQTADRRVASTEVNGARVSTVFLGLDHSWNGPPPLLFETLVFGGALDGEMDRYSTWDEAEAGHAKMVARVTALAN